MPKKCSRCGLEKELSEYYDRKSRRPGSKISTCKSCVALQGKAWAQKNPARMKELLSTWYRKQLPKFSKSRSALYRAKHKALGLCAGCCSPAMENSMYCRNHYIQHTARCRLGFISKDIIAALEAKWEAQGGLCFYSKKPLVMGTNASLDHILPQKRFRDTAANVDNLVWADGGVNRMKGPRTSEEFIELCRQIVAVADLRK